MIGELSGPSEGPAEAAWKQFQSEKDLHRDERFKEAFYAGALIAYNLILMGFRGTTEEFAATTAGFKMDFDRFYAADVTLN